ncbi:unnamed protein product [Haemonchus placei]|uniref:Uncharacterized protein n=1 Tax=Haemonchus placei TaxID=6290 RepID=A0A0N4X6S2_HAEPC|nr:unnamed protein product [Haemonchus placei]
MAGHTYKAPDERIGEAIRLDCIFLEELGSGGPHERDWKGIATALLVIMIICSLIALAVLVLTPKRAIATVISAELQLRASSALAKLAFHPHKSD